MRAAHSRVFKQHNLYVIDFNKRTHDNVGRKEREESGWSWERGYILSKYTVQTSQRSNKNWGKIVGDLKRPIKLTDSNKTDKNKIEIVSAQNI